MSQLEKTVWQRKKQRSLENGYLGKMIRMSFTCFIAFVSDIADAKDSVPYTIKKVVSVGSGYLELIGPGKSASESKVLDYEGIWYINSKNIDSMSSVSGVYKGCILRYSSEDYAEIVSVFDQSCVDVLSEIEKTNKR